MGIIVPLVSASGCCSDGVYDNLCALERGEWEAEEPYNNSLSSHGVQWDHHLQLSCPQNKAPGVQVLFIINSICCAKDGGRLVFLF